MKKILDRFIEGLAHFGMLRGAKMSLALNGPKYIALHSNSNNTISENAPYVERK